MKINSNFYVPYTMNFKSKGKCEKQVAQELKRSYFSQPCYKPYYLERRNTLLSDTKAFSKHMEKKIKDRLMVKTEADIQNIIDNTVKETGADEKLVSEVLGRVAQFSSYNQLPSISKTLMDNDVFSISYSGDATNLNDDFLYLDEIKHMLILDRGGKNKAYFVDFNNLNCAKEQYYRELRFKENGVEVYRPLKFFVVDGWNYRKDGQTKSYTMLGSEDSLENTVKSIVQDIQQTGKSVDEVLNGEILDEIKTQIDDELEVVVVKNDNLTDYSAKSIAQIMEPRYPKAEEIESAINLVAKDNKFLYMLIEKKPADMEKLLCLYLDTMFDCYSPQTLDVELKKKYQAIERKVQSLGKTMDDVYYFVPDKNKSFNLITRQFAKVNNIDNDKLIEPHSYELFEDGKVGVVLDDFSGSGESQISLLNYNRFLRRIYPYCQEGQQCHILFAPIFATEKAKDYVERYIKSMEREGIDFFMPNKVVSFDKTMQDHLQRNDIKSLKDLYGGSGYSSSATSVVFPYSIPDNNTAFASLIASMFHRDVPDNHAFYKNIERNWLYWTNLSTYLENIQERVKNENNQ